MPHLTVRYNNGMNSCLSYNSRREQDIHFTVNEWEHMLNPRTWTIKWKMWPCPVYEKHVQDTQHTGTTDGKEI